MAAKSTHQVEEQSNQQSRDIQQLQIDVAGIKKDLGYQSKTIGQLDIKMDRVATTVENLKYVPFETFQAYQQSRKEQDLAFNARLQEVEDYQQKNDPGVKFINRIFGNLTTALVLAATAVILGGVAYNVISGAG